MIKDENKLNKDPIAFPYPDIDSSKWYISKEDFDKTLKKKTILDYYNSEFPKNKLKDADDVYKIASRSKLVASRLAAWNAAYSLQVSIPSFFRDVIKPSDYEEASNIVSKLSESSKIRNDSIAKAVNEFNEAVREAEEIFNNIKYESIKNNKFASIILLNQNDLPLSIILSIEKYSPLSSNSPDQKAYARESLILYQKYLIQKVNDNPSIDINAIIDSNRSK